MNAILALLGKDIRLFLRHRGELLLTFLVPIVMATVFGLIFGGNGSSDSNPVTILFLDRDHSPFSERLKFELLKEKTLLLLDSAIVDGKILLLDSNITSDRIARGKNSVALVVPAHAFDTLVAMGSIHLEIWNDPKATIETNIVSGIVQEVVFGKIPELMSGAMTAGAGKILSDTASISFTKKMQEVVSQSFHIRLDSLQKNWWGGGGNNAQLADMLLRPVREAKANEGKKVAPDTTKKNFNFMGNMFHFEEKHIVGKDIASPGIAQSIAGTAVMFLLFSIGGGAQVLLREKREGTLRRLLISGVSTRSLLIEKWLFLLLIGMCQLYAMFLFGKLAFGLEIGRAPLQLLFFSFCTVSAINGIGMFLAAIAKSEEMANSLVTIVALSMSAIGGSMVPVFFMPLWLQSIGKFSVNYWAMDSFHNYFWRRLPFSDSLLNCGILLAASVILTTTSTLVFSNRIRNN